MRSVTIAQPVHERFGRYTVQSVHTLHMPSRVSLICRPKAVPPWAASTRQCSSCHCCSACGARARLGQHHAGECGTGPAAHQAAWQVAGTPTPISTVAEHSQTALSMPALVGPVGEQEYAAGKQQSRLAGSSGMVDVSTYQCEREISLKSACSRRQLANIWIAHSFSSVFFVTLNLPRRSCMLSS